MDPSPVWVVTGPTAGGKAALALAIARRFSVPILSLDSMKIYRGMNIGTAKPTADLIRETPFHLVDVRDPWEAFSVGDYLQEANQLTPTLPKPWLFSGGTSLYVHALLEGIFDGPPAQPELRARLAGEAARDGLDQLHRRLGELDPPAAAKIHPTDQRRIVRALEVIELCGERFSKLQTQRKPFLRTGSFRLLGIARPRAELHARIDARVERMFEAGWVDEVEQLWRDHSPPWSPAASQSIGYTQILEALESGEDPRSRIPTIQTRTRRFSRSQMTWYRKMPVEWWAPEERDVLLDDLESSLEDYRVGREFRAPQPERLAFRDR